MKKIAIALFVFSLCTTSCKKKIEAVCDITFDTPAEGQMFDSGDTIKVHISYGDLENFGDSLTLHINQIDTGFAMSQQGGSYEYSFVREVTDSNTDTINLAAVSGRATGAVCRREITVYVQP